MKSPDDDYQKALQYAFLLLRYRDRSQREIVQRLQRKGFTEEAAGRVAGYLKEKGFVDDAKLAESLKKRAVEQKYLGRKGVVYYLVSRGIPREIADGMSGDDEQYLDAARTFVEKKMKQMQGMEPFAMKKRLWAALARKGYSPDIIGRVLKAYSDEDGIYQ